MPTASDMWPTGERFAKLWNVTLQKNFESFRDRRKRPIWLDKMWQAVWNWNDHNQGHGIQTFATHTALRIPSHLSLLGMEGC